MGKTVATSRVEVPNWFHAGVIAPPNYDPPRFEVRVSRTLDKLLRPKSRTHKIGIYGAWAEPISVAVAEADGAPAREWRKSTEALPVAAVGSVGLSLVATRLTTTTINGRSSPLDGGDPFSGTTS